MIECPATLFLTKSANNGRWNLRIYFADNLKTSRSIIIYSVHLQYSMFPKWIFLQSYVRCSLRYLEGTCLLLRVGDWGVRVTLCCRAVKLLGWYLDKTQINSRSSPKVATGCIEFGPAMISPGFWSVCTFRPRVRIPFGTLILVLSSCLLCYPCWRGALRWSHLSSGTLHTKCKLLHRKIELNPYKGHALLCRSEVRKTRMKGKKEVLR